MEGRMPGIPKICSLPHSLHFSQPTQSMTRVMFWKCFCKSCLSSTAFAPFHNRPSSKGMGQVFFSDSLLTCKVQNDLCQHGLASLSYMYISCMSQIHYGERIKSTNKHEKHSILNEYVSLPIHAYAYADTIQVVMHTTCCISRLVCASCS